MNTSTLSSRDSRSNFGASMVFTLFTNDAELARRADAAGIDRIGIDLESIGKGERQGHTASWISDHRIEHLADVRGTLSSAALFARTNPIHEGSRDEIEALIDAGVQVLMLPMFRTVSEAETFVRLVDGRAEVSLLAETAAALVRLHEIVRVPGIAEIHLGLNDLHLDMSLASHFEVLASDVIDAAAAVVHEAGIAFGFGGVGRVTDDRLPIASDLIYAQLARLGANRTLISRVFTGEDYRQLDLPAEVRQVRARLCHWRARPQQALLDAREELRAAVRDRYG